MGDARVCPLRYCRALCRDNGALRRCSGARGQTKPNILVIWGDDIGRDNVNA